MTDLLWFRTIIVKYGYQGLVCVDDNVISMKLISNAMTIGTSSRKVKCLNVFNVSIPVAITYMPHGNQDQHDIPSANNQHNQWTTADQSQ